MKHLRAALAGILALVSVTAAVAQTFPTIPSQSVIGRLGASGTSGPSQAIPFATMAAQFNALAGIPSGVFVTAAPYNARCDGVTDDTAAIQAAISATPSTGWTIYIPRGAACVIASGLNFKGHPNLHFEGFGGMSTGASTPARLIYTGAAGIALDFRDSAANGVAHMSITASNAGFNGTIIAADSTNVGVNISSFFRMNDVTIGNSTSTSGVCLDISETIEAIIENTNFTKCAPAIQGMSTVGQNTTVTIRNNQFVTTAAAATASIIGCGDSWLIQNNAFEPLSNGQGNAFFNSSALPCKGIIFDGNWFGDSSVGGGQWVQLTAQGATIRGGRMAAIAGSNLISLTAGTGYVFEGISLEGTGTSAAVVCASNPTGGIIKGNTFLGGIVAVSGTCVGFTDREGNSPSISSATVGQVPIGQVAADALWKTISGACTISNVGVLTCTSNTNMPLGTGLSCSAVPQNATSFFGTMGCWSATEANWQTPVSAAFTARNLQVKVTSTPAGGQTYIATVRKNTADTSITCTISNPATTCSDLSNTASFAVGDLIAVKLVASATAGNVNAVNTSITAQTTSP